MKGKHYIQGQTNDQIKHGATAQQSRCQQGFKFHTESKQNVIFTLLFFPFDIKRGNLNQLILNRQHEFDFLLK